MCKFFGHWRREFNESEHHHGQHRNQAQGHIGARKGRTHQGAGLLRQVGPQHGANQSAGHHQRDCFFAPGERGQFGRRKAVQIGVGVVVARDHGGRAQQPEVLVHNGVRTQQSRRQRHQEAQLKRHLASEAVLRFGHQSGGQGATDDIAHDRQGGHPAQRRQAQAHQAVDGDEGDVVGQEKALADGQQPEVSVHRGGSGSAGSDLHSRRSASAGM